MIGDNRLVGNKENAEVEQWWNRNNGLGGIKKLRERSNGGGARIEPGRVMRAYCEGCESGSVFATNGKCIFNAMTRVTDSTFNDRGAEPRITPCLRFTEKVVCAKPSFDNACPFN